MTDYSQLLPLEEEQSAYDSFLENASKMKYKLTGRFAVTSSKPLVLINQDIHHARAISEVLDGLKKRYRAVAKCRNMDLRARLHTELDVGLEKIEEDVKQTKKKLDAWKPKVAKCLTSKPASTLSHAENNMLDQFEKEYIQLYVNFEETKNDIVKYRQKANKFIAGKLHASKENIEYFDDMTLEAADQKLILMQHMESDDIKAEEFWAIEKANQDAMKVEKAALELKETWDHIETLVLMNQQTFDSISQSISQTNEYVQVTEKSLNVALKMQTQAIKAKMMTLCVVAVTAGTLALMLFFSCK